MRNASPDAGDDRGGPLVEARIGAGHDQHDADDRGDSGDRRLPEGAVFAVRGEHGYELKGGYGENCRGDDGVEDAADEDDGEDDGYADGGGDDALG